MDLMNKYLGIAKQAKGLMEKRSTQEEPKEVATPIPLEEMSHIQYEASTITIEWKTRSGKVVYIAPSLAILKSKRREGEAWFLPEDVRALKGKSPEMVDKFIDIFEVYPGTKITN